MRLIRNRLCGWLLAAAAVMHAGCSGSVNTATVTGKVTVDGKPVTAGTVVFESEDGRAQGSGYLRTDGSFKVAEAPIGPCKIVVKVSQFNRSTTGGAMGAIPGGPAAGGASGRSPMAKDKAENSIPDDAKLSGPPAGESPGLVYVAIDKKYESLESTDLRYTVVKGEQTHNIIVTK